MEHRFIQPQRGFTLVEVMIVVAILGVLIAIAVPNYQYYQPRSQVTRVISETGALRNSVELCLLEDKSIVVLSGDSTSTSECAVGANYSNLLGTVTSGSTSTTGYPTVSLTDRTITGVFGNNAAAVLTDTQVQWTRSSNGGWTCASTVPLAYNMTVCPTTATE